MLQFEEVVTESDGPRRDPVSHRLLGEHPCRNPEVRLACFGQKANEATGAGARELGRMLETLSWSDVGVTGRVGPTGAL